MATNAIQCGQTSAKVYIDCIDSNTPDFKLQTEYLMKSVSAAFARFIKIVHFGTFE